MNAYRGEAWMREPCRSCPRAGARLRRLPLPGVRARRRRGRGRPGLRALSAPRGARRARASATPPAEARRRPFAWRSARWRTRADPGRHLRLPSRRRRCAGTAGHKRDRYLTDVLGALLRVGAGVPRGRGRHGHPAPAGAPGARRRRRARACSSRRSGRDWTRAMQGVRRGGACARLAGARPLRLRAEAGLAELRHGTREGVRRDGMPEKSGTGVFAAELLRRFASLPVEEEGRLHDARLRENWIERVFAYRRLRSALRGPSVAADASWPSTPSTSSSSSPTPRPTTARSAASSPGPSGSPRPSSATRYAGRLHGGPRDAARRREAPRRTCSSTPSATCAAASPPGVTRELHASRRRLRPRPRPPRRPAHDAPPLREPPRHRLPRRPGLPRPPPQRAHAPQPCLALRRGLAWNFRNSPRGPCMRAVHWLRSDLRLDDNRALGEAARRASELAVRVRARRAACWRASAPAPRACASSSTASRASPRTSKRAARAWCSAAATRCGSSPACSTRRAPSCVTWNRDYSPFAKARDAARGARGGAARRARRDLQGPRRLRARRGADEGRASPTPSTPRTGTPGACAGRASPRSPSAPRRLPPPIAGLASLPLPTAEDLGFAGDASRAPDRRRGRRAAAASTRSSRSRSPATRSAATFPPRTAPRASPPTCASACSRSAAASRPPSSAPRSATAASRCRSGSTSSLWRDFYHAILDRHPHVDPRRPAPRVRRRALERRPRRLRRLVSGPHRLPHRRRRHAPARRRPAGCTTACAWSPRASW